MLYQKELAVIILQKRLARAMEVNRELVARIEENSEDKGHP
jgi:predicted transcriptional regulator